MGDLNFGSLRPEVNNVSENNRSNFNPNQLCFFQIPNVVQDLRLLFEKNGVDIVDRVLGLNVFRVSVRSVE